MIFLFGGIKRARWRFSTLLAIRKFFYFNNISSISLTVPRWFAIGCNFSTCLAMHKNFPLTEYTYTFVKSKSEYLIKTFSLKSIKKSFLKWSPKNVISPLFIFFSLSHNYPFWIILLFKMSSTVHKCQIIFLPVQFNKHWEMQAMTISKNKKL